MEKQFTAQTTYFLQEGKDNLRECLRIAFQSAKDQNVSKVIIFTAKGEGVRAAIESMLSQEAYSKIKIVAVAFPYGKIFTDKEKKPIEVRIAETDAQFFVDNHVPIVRAHLPFDPITPYFKSSGMLGQDLNLVSEALAIFGGSMALCVQAITMACDAGEVEIGEHVIAMTSDTAILAQASNTDRMLGELIVREILCKPAVLTISRRERSEKMPGQLALDIKPEPVTPIPAELPASSVAEKSDAEERKT